MQKIEEIINEYYSKKENIDKIFSNNDAVSNHIGQKELQSLKIDTIEKLNENKKSLVERWGDLIKKLTSVTRSIDEANDAAEIQILSEQSEAYKTEIGFIEETVSKINNYLSTDLDTTKETLVKLQPWENKKVEVDEDLNLEDKSTELENNSNLLESSVEYKPENVLPFYDESLQYKKPVDRDTLLVNSTLDITKDVNSLNVNDSDVRFISDSENKEFAKVLISQVKLPNGKYVNRVDFVEALKQYVEANKNRKLLVLDTKEYRLDPKNLEKSIELLNECSGIFVDIGNKATAIDDDVLEELAPVPQAIKPGKYIPVKDAMYSVDELIKEVTPEEIEREKIKALSKRIEEMEK